MCSILLFLALHSSLVWTALAALVHTEPSGPFQLPWAWVSASVYHNLPQDQLILCIIPVGREWPAFPDGNGLDCNLCWGETRCPHSTVLLQARTYIFMETLYKPMHISGVTLYQNLPLESIQLDKRVSSALPKQWEKYFCANEHFQGSKITVQYVCLCLHLGESKMRNQSAVLIYTLRAPADGLDGASRALKTHWNGSGMSEPDGMCLKKSIWSPNVHQSMNGLTKCGRSMTLLELS